MKYGPMSVGNAGVKHSLKQRERKERQICSETRRQTPVGLCSQLKCTVRQGKWSSMLKSGTVKHFSEEVKQVMYECIPVSAKHRGEHSALKLHKPRMNAKDTAVVSQ